MEMLIGLVILVVVGYILFGKKADDIGSVSTPLSRSADESNTGLTGVAKYLQNQKETETTESAVAVTGVARYLQNQPSPKKSGVAKYVARQSLSVKKVSSVSKYIAKQVATAKKVPAEKPTGVAKYLETRKQTPVSSVSKYIAKKIVATREVSAAQKPATGVEKYLRRNQA